MNHREVMQQALAALEIGWSTTHTGKDARELGMKAITALRAALAEFDADPQNAGQTQTDSKQEPVAKVELMKTGGNAGLATRIVEIDDHLRERLRPGQMLYTHPAPKRQPLPKHDQHCVDVPGYGLMATKLVRAVERAHGIGGQDE